MYILCRCYRIIFITHYYYYIFNNYIKIEIVFLRSVFPCRHSHTLCRFSF